MSGPVEKMHLIAVFYSLKTLLYNNHAEFILTFHWLKTVTYQAFIKRDTSHRKL